MEDVCKESIASMIKTPEDALKGLYEMVVEFRALLNCCSVDFIVDNLFTETLSPAIQKDLVALEDSQVASLPQSLFKNGEGEVGASLGKGWLLVKLS